MYASEITSMIYEMHEPMDCRNCLYLAKLWVGKERKGWCGPCLHSVLPSLLLMLVFTGGKNSKSDMK